MELKKFKVGEPIIFYFKTNTADVGGTLTKSGLFISDSFSFDGGTEEHIGDEQINIRTFTGDSHNFFVIVNVGNKRGYGFINVTVDTEKFEAGFIVGADWETPVSITYSYNEQDRILTVTRTPLDSDGNPIEGISPKIESFIYDEDNSGRVKKVLGEFES